MEKSINFSNKGMSKSSITFSLFLYGLLLSTLLLMVCADRYGAGPEGSPAENEIWMQNTSFNPKNKTISKGTTITWINKDSFAHTITSGTRNNPDGLFDSGNVGKNATFRFTFEDPGTYPYYCDIHPGMDGTITVQTTL